MKGSLFQLFEEYEARQQPDVSKKTAAKTTAHSLSRSTQNGVCVARHFDKNGSISLEYDFREDKMRPSGRSTGLSSAPVGAFFVESFEENDLSEMPANSGSVAGVIGGGSGGGELAAMKLATGGEPGRVAAVSAASPQDALTQKAPANYQAAPDSTVVDVGPLKPAVLPIAANEDDAFEADLAAILSGEKQVLAPPNGGGQPQKKQPPPAVPEKAAAAQSTSFANEKAGEHAIFDRIAKNMPFANSFELGSFDLSNRFDELDRAIDREKKPAEKPGVILPPPPVSKPVQRQVSAAEFVEDLDAMKRSNDRAAAFSKAIPLDPGAGGMSINEESLDIGDIIVSTTNDPISTRIRQITGSEVSHARVYVGKNAQGIGEVIEAHADGVIVQPLEDSILDSTVAVAFRHRQMTPGIAMQIVDFHRASLGKKFDMGSLINNAGVQMAANICESVSSSLRDACRNFAGRILLGPQNNDAFYCSELVFEAFRSAGLQLTSAEPHWTSPQDIVRLNLNGTLEYIGHLKA